MKKLDLSGGSKARPFLSPIAWATYTALLTVIMHAVTRWETIKSGLGPTDFISDATIKNLIKAALPNQAEFIDQYGSSGYFLLIDQLEMKLLDTLRDMLTGGEADKASVDQAAEILRRSNEVERALSTPRVPST
jgi:hypothetical protein